MIDWADIHYVLLDMDGTLLDLHFDNQFWQELVPSRYAERRGLDIFTAKFVLGRVFERKTGTLDWYCIDYWSRELGLDIELLKRELSHLVALQPHAIEFLQALRISGKRTILVTNAHNKSLALKLEHTRLDRHLDAIVSAHDIGHPKEAGAFWKELHDLEYFDAAHTLLIDDNLDVLRSAHRYGIKHLLAIKTPDRRAPPKPTDEFRAIHGFQEIMPTS